MTREAENSDFRSDVLFAWPHANTRIIGTKRKKRWIAKVIKQGKRSNKLIKIEMESFLIHFQSKFTVQSVWSAFMNLYILCTSSFGF